MFAHAALENRGVGLVAAVNHRIAGSAIGYVAGFEPPKIGVIYYVYVKREHRGRGLGKVLVASLEELLENMGAEILIASTRGHNIASRRLFNSMGYSELTWENVEELLGGEKARALEMASCSYEDDIIMVKPYVKLLNIELDVGNYEDLWFNICYKPWIEYRNSHMRH